MGSKQEVMCLDGLYEYSDEGVQSFWTKVYNFGG